MGHYEDIKIDRHDGWKYSHTSGTNGDDYYARVYVDDKGVISKDSYSQSYNEKNGNSGKPEKKAKAKDERGQGNKKMEKESCLKRILWAPFRLLRWIIKQLLKLLWWVIKMILVIVSFGMLGSVLNPKDDA